MKIHASIPKLPSVRQSPLICKVTVQDIVPTFLEILHQIPFKPSFFLWSSGVEDESLFGHLLLPSVVRVLIFMKTLLSFCHDRIQLVSVQTVRCAFCMLSLHSVLFRAFLYFGVPAFRYSDISDFRKGMLVVVYLWSTLGKLQA